MSAAVHASSVASLYAGDVDGRREAGLQCMPPANRLDSENSSGTRDVRLAASTPV